MTLHPGDLDFTNPDLFVEHAGPPHDYLAMLRREAPVSWNPPPAVHKSKNTRSRTGFWVLAKHADIVNVSRHPRLFSSNQRSPFFWDIEDPVQAEHTRLHLIAMDPPQHVKYRGLVQRGFTPRMVRKLEPVIQNHARDIVDRVATRGECEFVEDLACELPLTLLCELVGVPYEDRKKIFDWSNQLVGADDPDMHPAESTPLEAAAQMYLYCNELAAQKREQPDDTLISKYVNGEVDGHKLSDMEINQFFVLLSVAGNETTRNATSHFMRLMFEHPEQREELMGDLHGLLPGAIEEALRFSPPVMNFARTAISETELRGVKIRAGDKLYLSYPSANRDEEVFENSMRFDIRREKNDHIAFGIGEHFCLGANLARMQLRCILSELLTRLPDMAPAGPVGIQRSSFIHGIKHMPVRFTPER